MSEAITNPILNSPFTEPDRHFQFEKDTLTSTIVNGRRNSAYFVPIAKSRKRGQQQQELEFEETLEENEDINRIREAVKPWREGGWPGVTPTTRMLLQHWNDPERMRPVLFCQKEAAETIIYLTEAADKFDGGWIGKKLQKDSERYNPGLYRIAMKMATGSGKTLVMGMLIAWQTLNKLANKQDKRFTNRFLIVTPGITIRDRLRVLLPSDPGNYYQQFDMVPSWERHKLGTASIIITNYHAFLRRETLEASTTTKEIVTQGDTDRFKESPDQMVNRVCREFGSRKGEIIVLNDEAHHCYRESPEQAARKLSREEKQEAKQRNEEGRVWVAGLEAIQKKLGIKAVYDLSATPFFLAGSGYGEGRLFPWVVSDFSLIDAIEAGIVKVPRVPVSDDSMTGEEPVYRTLYQEIKDELPDARAKADLENKPPHLHRLLQGALHNLYAHYEKQYRIWEQDQAARAAGRTPPVFIVVCNNTAVSKLVFDYIAGWERLIDGEPVVQAGGLEIFRNDNGQGGWQHRPNTILVDSAELESGETMSSDFKKIASREIEEFKQEYRRRFPGRSVETLTDEELLREVMNTVGKAGKLGEHVKCVVSVSMLTEGWDANTVTHILGVRAFSTQLLCEQVVGRGLRRMSYATNEEGKFSPEYAEVYGIPFKFINTREPREKPIGPPPVATRVRALEERIDQEISFPRLVGYRYDFREEPLQYQFTGESRLTLTPKDIPTQVENAPIVGESVIMRLDDLKQRRMQSVAFLLAKLTLEKYFRSDGTQKTEREKTHRYDADVQMWRFPEVLEIATAWLNLPCVVCQGDAFPQMLLLLEYAHDAADRIHQSIIRGTGGDKILCPILHPAEPTGSTRWVDFDTTRPTWITDPDKCHISHVVADTGTWEQKMAQVLEDMPEVVRYVKNHNLNFTIPYTLNGADRRYHPDFIAQVDDGHGPDDLLNLVLEVSGEQRKDKAAKVATARNLWIPAVNSLGTFGRWAFLEISDPWDAKTTIRAVMAAQATAAT